MGGTILITGGAGFIGSNLIGRLLERPENKNTKITCIDNFDSYYAPQAKRNNIRAFLGNKNFGLVEADIRNKNSIDLAFAKNRPETVVHLAARPGVRPSIAEPLIYEDVNIRGTLNILEAVKKHG
ncbi:GDP-mannose 4,6-dehydratase, partial [Candidatus Micrarchaeota archaeon]|nr:GDP-mannose 4,6-dehydratase [Candidatus Micrarchaeota archaeon]